MALIGKRQRNPGGGRSSSLAVMVCLTVLCCLYAAHHHQNAEYSTEALLRAVAGQETTLLVSNSNINVHSVNPLAIPPGQAVNLPSVRIEKKAVDQERKIYGGAGDQQHLGGFTDLDLAGVSPAIWRQMLTEFGVHSVLDVGCGRGTSTAWFALQGCRAQCVEGSHDAVEKNMFRKIVPNGVVEHDFSRGPWWPGQTFDAVWAVEFLEHVGVQYQYNYVSAFRKAALLFVTSSQWGGWHHVEVHGDAWWIRKYESYGFKYDLQLTNLVRATARAEMNDANTNQTAPNGKPYNAQHIWMTMKVFVNPVVAALPEHAHLFPEHGCYAGKDRSKPPPFIGARKCGSGKNGKLETPLPPDFFPLVPTAEHDKAWADLVKSHITAE